MAHRIVAKVGSQIPKRAWVMEARSHNTWIDNSVSKIYVVEVVSMAG